MSSVRRRGFVALLATALLPLILIGCGESAATPEIVWVRPAVAVPREMLIISGRNFDEGDMVWIDGRPAARVTWVNDRTLTAVVPPDLPTGAYPLEVRSADGERDTVVMNVAAPGPARSPAAARSAPTPTATPTPRPVAPLAPATTPRPSAPPVARGVPHQPPAPAFDARAQAQAQIEETFAQVNATLARLGLPLLPTPSVATSP